MAEVKGLRTILSRALPTGVDGDVLARWQLRSGRSFNEWVTLMSTAIAGFNTRMVNKWGRLFYITEDLMMEYPNGGSVTPAPRITDVSRPRPKHGTTIGHMLPLWNNGDSVGYTKQELRDIREAQFNADVTRILDSLEWRFEIDVLTRLMTNTENLVLQGGSGYDVPWVRGTGGNVDFAPPAYGGQAFTTSHDHFVGYASASYTFGTMLDALADNLVEHGHTPPFEVLVSDADIASYRALADFVQPTGNTPIVIIDGAGQTSLNRYFSSVVQDMMSFGGYLTKRGYVDLIPSYRIDTGYACMYKSMGNNVEGNPLAIRVHPDEGFGAGLVAEFASNDFQYPLKQLNVEFEYGVGVGMDRTKAALGYRSAGGSWSNPTVD